MGLVAAGVLVMCVACSSAAPSRSPDDAPAPGDGEGIECPGKRDAEGKPPEALALIYACNAADGDALTLRNFKVENMDTSGLRAEYRILADDISCADSCPKIMEYKVKMFVNTTGAWAGDEASGWDETPESVRARAKHHAEDVLSRTSYTVKGQSAKFYGALKVDAVLAPQGEAIIVWLQVELPDGRTAVVKSTNGVGFQFGPVPPEDSSLNTLTGTGDIDPGETVTLKQYRVAVAYGLNNDMTDFDYIKSGWTPVNQSTPAAP